MSQIACNYKLSHYHLVDRIYIMNSKTDQNLAGSFPCFSSLCGYFYSIGKPEYADKRGPAVYKPKALGGVGSHQDHI